MISPGSTNFVVDAVAVAVTVAIIGYGMEEMNEMKDMGHERMSFDDTVLTIA